MFVIFEQVDVFVRITNVVQIQRFHCTFDHLKRRIHIQRLTQRVRVFVLLSVSLQGLNQVSQVLFNLFALFKFVDKEVFNLDFNLSLFILQLFAKVIKHLFDHFGV